MAANPVVSDRPPAGETRWQAVDPLVMELTDARIVVSSPRLPGRLRVSAAVASLLVQARSGVELSEPVAPTLAKLIDTGYPERLRLGPPSVMLTGGA